MKFTSLISAFLFSALTLSMAQAEYVDVAMGFAQHENGLGCPSGGKRVRKAYHTTNFSISGEGKTVTENQDVFGVPVKTVYNSYAQGFIRGPYTEGAIEGKTTGNLFFGVSFYSDIMGVQTIRGEDQKLIGANVYLSFCEQPPVFTEARKLENFRTPFEISVSGGFDFPANVCAFGTVQAYLTTIDLPKTDTQTAFRANNTFGPITPQAAMQVCAGINQMATADGPRQTGEQNPAGNPVVTSVPGEATPH